MRLPLICWALALPMKEYFGRIIFFVVGCVGIANVWYPLVPLQERGVFAALVLAALFLCTRVTTPFWRRLDVPNAIAALVSYGYIAVYWEDILLRAGAPTTADLVFGIVGAYVVLAACMRSLGAGLSVVVVVFLAYAFLGQHLPGWAGGHRGYSLSRVFTFIFLSENGILGFAIGACMKYIGLFLFLGKVLEMTGALGFIMALCRATFRTGTAGPPMMAVGASALLGTVTGSSMSNVYVSGAVTIPLMKKVGLKPEMAAAIEAAASNGSQIMPPVLGFAVFFMMSLINASYLDIVLAATIPGCLYFFSLMVTVWLRTRNIGPLGPGGATALPDEPPPDRILAILTGIPAVTFVATLGTLITFLANHDSIQLSAAAAIGVGIAISFLGRDRFSPRKLALSLEKSGRELTNVAVICLVLGLITGPVLLTGLGTKLPALLTVWAEGELWLMLIMCFVASVILGMGVPTSIAYVIVALLVAGTMVQLGVDRLAAHLFVLYAAMAASITPPVALTAYVAAGLAGANFWKTGWLAAFLGIPKYFVPFAFIYRPALLLNGGPLDVILATLATGGGLVAITGGSMFLHGRGIAGYVAGALTMVGGFLLAVPPFGPEVLIAAGMLLAVGLTIGNVKSLLARP